MFLVLMQGLKFVACKDQVVIYSTGYMKALLAVEDIALHFEASMAFVVAVRAAPILL
jgi:hypothetical protein